MNQFAKKECDRGGLRVSLTRSIGGSVEQEGEQEEEQQLILGMKRRAKNVGGEYGAAKNRLASA